MARTSANSLRETVVPLSLLVGDALITFAGLLLGWWLRYQTPLGHPGIDVPSATLAGYQPLLLVGVALLIGAFAQLGLYDARMLLRRYQSLSAIIKGTTFWLLGYLGLSLVLKFDPPISRLFAVYAFVCVIVLLYLWRTFAYAVLTRTPLRSRLQRRTVLLGWNDNARTLAATIGGEPAHPLAVLGVVPLPGETCDPAASPCLRTLGMTDMLESILVRERADVLIATRLDLPRAQVRQLTEICERCYVEWKVIPDAFELFPSGLRLQTIGRLPVLGVEELAINRLFSRAIKRGFDLVGALFGLFLSAPLVAVLAALIKRESPGGPVFFQQQRVGANHTPFTLYKLRSMQPDAAASDAAHQSTTANDPRLLRLGALMRRWNLDELPQFWNVLRGDMSLVGPRPERPFHVAQLAQDIPHYLPRHLVKPGMTGWAQVNGLRGDTNLAARVQHDIYYIENWSVWLDVQILLLTVVRWKSPG